LGDGTLRIVARRDIKKDEELTLDYATFIDNTDMQFDCQCGEASCRKYITGHERNNPEVVEKYKGHFSPYIEGKIK